MPLDQTVNATAGFTYRFGDWVVGVPLTGLQALGVGRVCVLATGKTGAALHSLWTLARLDQIVPLFEEVNEAVVYLSGSDSTVCS